MDIYDERREGEEFYEENMFGECEKTLKKIKKERVFNIQYLADKKIFYIYELCDEWFYMYLTYEDCMNLSELFEKIAQKIKELESR